MRASNALAHRQGLARGNNSDKNRVIDLPLLSIISFYLTDTINASVVFNMIHFFCIHTQFLCINISMGISLFSCFAYQRFFFLQAVTHHVFFFSKIKYQSSNCHRFSIEWFHSLERMKLTNY